MNIKEEKYYQYPTKEMKLNIFDLCSKCNYLMRGETDE